MPQVASIPCFNATHSAPKTEVSIVACFLESQLIKAELMKTKNPSLVIKLSFHQHDQSQHKMASQPLFPVPWAHLP